MDVSTTCPLSRNPAAVLFDGEKLSDSTMQGIVRETNLFRNGVYSPSDRACCRVLNLYDAMGGTFCGSSNISGGTRGTLEKLNRFRNVNRRRFFHSASECALGIIHIEQSRRKWRSFCALHRKADVFLGGHRTPHFIEPKRHQVRLAQGTSARRGVHGGRLRADSVQSLVAKYVRVATLCASDSSSQSRSASFGRRHKAKSSITRRTISARSLPGCCPWNIR